MLALINIPPLCTSADELGFVSVVTITLEYYETPIAKSITILLRGEAFKACQELNPWRLDRALQNYFSL